MCQRLDTWSPIAHSPSLLHIPPASQFHLNPYNAQLLHPTGPPIHIPISNSLSIMDNWTKPTETQTDERYCAKLSWGQGDIWVHRFSRCVLGFSENLGSSPQRSTPLASSHALIRQNSLSSSWLPSSTLQQSAPFLLPLH
jgi:hypothetical protein